MGSKFSYLLVLASTLLVSCATGKSIKSVDDLQDDGKRNTVFLTHDINVYVTDKHASVKNTRLAFRCPKGNDLLKVSCFDLVLPYLGIKEVDGFGVHAFELLGAKVIKMKYDSYALRSVVHNIVIDRIPKTLCYYNRRTKKNDCNTNIENKSDTHRAGFPEPVAFNVVPGAGCYLGHLSITLVNNDMREFNIDVDSPLTEEKLSGLPPDIAARLLTDVNRPCK
ncbi:MAG: hypothetical protein AB8B87_08230 [Granulosicoccus sp.]